MSVLNEGIRHIGQRRMEVLPKHRPPEIEERAGYTVGREFGQVAEHEGVDYGRRDGLDHEPKRPKDGLLVDCSDVALDEEADQIAIMEKLAQIERKKTGLGLDYRRPALVFVRMCHFSHKNSARRRTSPGKMRSYSLSRTYMWSKKAPTRPIKDTSSLSRMRPSMSKALIAPTP